MVVRVTIVTVVRGDSSDCSEGVTAVIGGVKE